MRGPSLFRLAAVAVSVLTATTAAATPARAPDGRTCRTHASNGVCGPYSYARITNSNGYNTYTDQDMWAASARTTQTLTSSGPGHWSVVSDAKPADDRAVQTYPNVQQLFNDWTGAGWNGSGTAGDTPISRLRSLRSSFIESMPHNSTTIAEAAYDIWLSNIPRRYSDEVMVWVDNVNRGTGGATRIGSAIIGRQSFTVLEYGGPGGELIFSLNRDEQTGTVDILNMLKWLVTRGYEPSAVHIGQIEFGWEICSETTRVPHNRFTISSYSITAIPLGKRG